MISRRNFVIAAAALAIPQAGWPREGPWRIGFLYNSSRESAMETGRYPAFLDGMRALGYQEGRDFVILGRFGGGKEGEQRLPEMAEELVRSKVDVIVTSGGATGRAVKQATQSIPVVITLTNDPVIEGFAASLARPGGNFTGLGGFLTEVFPKHIEMLKLVVPNLSVVACLVHSNNPMHSVLLKRVEAAARPSGIRVMSANVDGPDTFERGIGEVARKQAQALIILGDSFFVQYFKQIAAFSNRNRLASIYSGREYPEAGGLMSYGPNFLDNYRRAANYVDKILKGAKPADLPFENPTAFQLVLNRTAAKAIGISLSRELLFRADTVIE